ncbi:hypothetical protein [Pseudomonas protegens]|uniref:hypothetical protein n=1 Tax=Pseudomonas protegens TaxID=380021 RepID=UPI000CD07335|nr:hypothetical protein [Pseudomonas protegens]POA88018.1 hypothetical protein C1883_16165 [Pseudomonas protegens]
MSEVQTSSDNSRTGLTATITGLLVSLSALAPADWSAEAKAIIPIIAGIISPFIAAGIYRLQRKVEQPPELTDYLAAYENDLKFQNKALKNKGLSQEDRAAIEARRSNTLLKMSTAHQDFRTSSLNISVEKPAG